MRLPRFIAVSGLRASRFVFSLFGFEIRDIKPPNRSIQDAEFYRPIFGPWLMPEWRQRLRADDPRSLLPLNAKYVMYSLARDAMLRCDGDLAECGVYKGGTAKILAELASDRPLHLFDTFAGMPDTDPTRDLHKAGDFADTNLATVRLYLAEHDNIRFVSGLIPDSLKTVRDRSFCFVHVDLDIYSAIKSACEFFYPRLQPGGVLLFDDYGHSSCPGARAAVDEFFADKREVMVSIATGQCAVRKLPTQQLA